MGDPSVLDERLAEIDRRLLAIQSGLEPTDAAPEAPRTVPSAPHSSAESERPADALSTADRAPEPAAALELVAGLQDMLEFHRRLLTSTAELLETYADALSHAPAVSPVTEVTEVSLSAGPLSSTEALRDFERALLELPQVRTVAVREFEGENRVVIDLHLAL